MEKTGVPEQVVEDFLGKHLEWGEGAAPRHGPFRIGSGWPTSRVGCNGRAAKSTRCRVATSRHTSASSPPGPV